MKEMCNLLLAAYVMAAPGLALETSPPVKQDLPPKKLLYRDDFDQNLSQWVVEQAANGTTRLLDGKLEIDDAGGCTVWFTNKLSGAILIEYEAAQIQQGGTNDRASDLNCFWMATDPKHPDNLFFDSQNRGGKFKNYDGLRLYYVGYGANGNTTTRFRRYPGDGSRPLLAQNDLTGAKFLNIPNQLVKIQVIADGNRIQFRRDGEIIFDFTDPEPFREGWFGFRTVRSHLRIGHFRVYQLESAKSQ